MSGNGTFVPSFETCTEVTDLCPAEITLYGDYFSKGNIVFLGGFGIMALIQLILGIKLRAWSFTFFLVVGTLMEAVGYLGRSVMAWNPWVFAAFAIQLMLLVLGPTFVVAAISVTFKHLVNYYDPSLSPIRPSLYPWIFVGSDFIAIIVQGGGAALAGAATSGATPNESLLKTADGMLIGGVSFQVANMVLCGLYMVWYWRRYQTSKRRMQSSSAHGMDASIGRMHRISLNNNGGGGGIRGKIGANKVKYFCWSLVAAYVAVLIRCIYRIPEMEAGFGSDLMKHEASFLILDGLMLLIACGLLTICHPIFLFKDISARHRNMVKQQHQEIPMY